MYDGIPGFVISNDESTVLESTLLATYCGHNFGKPPSVEAKSGYLTVYFEGSIQSSKHQQLHDANLLNVLVQGVMASTHATYNPTFPPL